MDKIAINAVAGSGKTTYLIENINLEEQTLIVTYTNSNNKVLKSSVIERFGFIPENIEIINFFSFIFSICLRPLYTPLIDGIDFSFPANWNKSSFNSVNYIYSNKISKLILTDTYRDKVHERLEKYYDKLFVDEMQDLTSDDFDLMLSFASLNIPVIIVGDFYQRTYCSSQRGNKGNGIRNDYDKYNKALIKAGYDLDISTLSKSYRCSPNICKFVRDEIGINIFSHNENKTEIKKIGSKDKIISLLEDDDIIKLFYWKSFEFDCKTDNWGNSKGNTYANVCVIINDSSSKSYKVNGSFKDLANITKSKLYVACTRTKGNLYLIDQKDIPKSYKNKK